ncbi:hypothetical protein [Rhabdothermincola salaria]|uniref:hypothetical protein n=1 Tax=Rhabdothermincola salaria TaxID=2903142 RepID=UPI001E4D44E6|nr:hypothetical protein [Rhabdothermincola salaria]MCD9624355.1 hypothetical protein [Rhabdothermincola salaria]
MARRRSLTALVAGVSTLSLLLAACGGGDDGTLSDEEFCAELEALEEADAAGEGSDELDAEALAQLRDLADRAPNEEVSSALETLGNIAEDMEGLDEDDPDAFGEVMALMFNPEVISAGETLDTYLTETCGFEDDAFEMVESDTDEPVGDADPDGDPVPSSGSAMDDLDSGELREAMVAYLEDEGFEPSSSGMGISGGSTVTAGFEAEGVEGADAMALCDELAGLVADATDLDDTVALEITLDGTLVAERAAGGSCDEV